MDAFQGHYKDGTDSLLPILCCSLSSFKIILFFVYAVTLSGLFFAIGTVVLLLLAMVIVIEQPYKVKFATYNTIDTILILLFAALYASIVCLNVSQMKSLKFVKMYLIIVLLTAIFPLLYIFCSHYTLAVYCCSYEQVQLSYITLQVCTTVEELVSILIQNKHEYSYIVHTQQLLCAYM